MLESCTALCNILVPFIFNSGELLGASIQYEPESLVMKGLPPVAYLAMAVCFLYGLIISF